MKENRTFSFIHLLLLSLFVVSCVSKEKQKEQGRKELISEDVLIVIEAENFTDSSKGVTIKSTESGISYANTIEKGWISLDVQVPVAGRYKSEIKLSSDSKEEFIVWIEDYYDNKDDRSYNITGNILVPRSQNDFLSYSRDGSPLNKGLHKMKLHFDGSSNIDWIKFSLLKEHETTPVQMTQKTKGSTWKMVWSDEFDGTEVDSAKWTYDIGDWGWGNYELQYYTKNRSENSRIENGNLIIEARKEDLGHKWTSARLTTRGKVSFLYGKIEFRAKVPPNKGNWAAGWTLGDDYVDELSWPYCGEIDIMESVGYEMDDITGNGIAHASVHCPAYYFKLGNQPTSTIDVINMNNEYHTYAIEWTEDGIKAFVDDQHYLTYSDTKNDLSWPFSKSQNIILNLAMGGGWGGDQGMDENITSQKMIIDYVRVYELQE